MDEGWGMLRWRVDQYCSYTVGTGHLQSLISGKEKLEKQAAKCVTVTPLTEPEGSSLNASGQEPDLSLNPSHTTGARHKDGAQGEQL